MSAMINIDDLEKGCFYGVGTDGVFYKLVPRIELPLAKKINVETGEIIYPTNADRIRGKDDEGLAEFIYSEMLLIPWCDMDCGNVEEPPCRQCVLKWLKQEAGT